MTCQETQEHIIAYIDQELPRVQRESLEEHFARCESCRLALDERKWLDQRIRRTVRGIPIPPGLEARVREHLGRRAAPLRLASRRYLPLAAGTLCLVLGILALHLLPDEEPDHSPVATASFPTLARSVARFHRAQEGRPPEKLSIATRDEREIEDYMRGSLGVACCAPDLSSEGLDARGASSACLGCCSCDCGCPNRSAYVRYENDGQVVTHIDLPRAPLERDDSFLSDEGGRAVFFHSEGGIGIAAVERESGICVFAGSSSEEPLLLRLLEIAFP